MVYKKYKMLCTSYNAIALHYRKLESGNGTDIGAEQVFVRSLDGTSVQHPQVSTHTLVGSSSACAHLRKWIVVYTVRCDHGVAGSACQLSTQRVHVAPDLLIVSASGHLACVNACMGGSRRT